MISGASLATSGFLFKLLTYIYHNIYNIGTRPESLLPTIMSQYHPGVMTPTVMSPSRESRKEAFPALLQQGWISMTAQQRRTKILVDLWCAP